MTEPTVVPLHPPTPWAMLDAHTKIMRERFHWWERLLYFPLFARVQIDSQHLPRLRELADHALFIYVTPQIGSLEYRYFNYLFRDEELPLVDHEHALMLHCETSEFFDDVVLERNRLEPWHAVVRALRSVTRPVYFVPLQFHWLRRPDRETPHLRDLLFGDPTKPGPLRQRLMLWYYAWRGPIAQIGAPLDAHDICRTLPSDDTAAALQLRATLLAQLSHKRKVLMGAPLKPKRWMVEQVLNGKNVQQAIYTAAADKHESVETAQHLARKYIEEIAADIRYRTIELLSKFLGWMFGTLYDGITITNPDGLARMRAAMERGAVVLVPNHRSHVDYLLLSHLLYQHNIALPHIASGINLSFWPCGGVARRGGAFFLRRTFAGNPLYRAVFAEYLQLLVQLGHCVEFFIEGGRSRTGKTLPPKMGILSMLVEGMQTNMSDDLQFLPVSFTYDHAIEQHAYAAELQGAPKKRENWWELLRLRRLFKQRYGHIYIHFGEPILYSSVVHAMHADTALLPAATTASSAPPADTAEADTATASLAQLPNKRTITQHLSEHLMHAINRGLLTTPSAVLACALLANPAYAQPEALIFDRSRLLLDYLQWRQARCSEGVTRDAAGSLRDALHHLAQSGRVVRHDQFAPISYSVPPAQRALLDYNKNTTMHSLVALAWLCRILTRQPAGSPLTFAALVDEYAFGQHLLRHEFSFATRYPLAAHVQHLLEFLLQRHWIRLDQPGKEIDTATIHIMAHGVDAIGFFGALVANYFEAYKAALLACFQMPPGGIGAHELPQHMMAFATHLHQLGQISYVEGIMQSHYKNALNIFREMGILSGKTYVQLAQIPQLSTVQAKLEMYG